MIPATISVMHTSGITLVGSWNNRIPSTAVPTFTLPPEGRPADVLSSKPTWVYSRE